MDAARFAAIGIGQSAPKQRHIGILHNSEDDMWRVLHLAWHCILKNEREIPPYFTMWVELRYDAQRLRQLAAFCRRVWRKNSDGGIPYAFSHPREALHPSTGAMLFGPTQFGLSCSSFVLAIFSSVGLDLVAYATWKPDRPGDREWQAAIIEQLRDRASESHLKHLQAEIGSVRFRPEEVAAGAALSPPSADMSAAEALGADIVRRLQ
jgi:hypothetical protein